MQERELIKSDIDFIRYLKSNGNDTLKKCYQCATCSVTCSLSPEEYAFPRKEMINAGWGLRDRIVHDPDIWLCHGCMDCSLQCPRGAKPADLMSSVRNFVYRYYSYPKFMGNALSSPKFLPVLLLLPVILISLLVMVTQKWDLANLFPIINGPFQYKDFIAHGPIEMLFIAGNLLIFSLAVLGFYRYWSDMNNHMKGKPKVKFVKAAYLVTIDFILHRKFSDCRENSNRYYGHLFVFYGFILALIATAIVVLDVMSIFGKFLPENMNLPFYIVPVFDINNDVHISELLGLITKLTGMAGGTLMIIGGLMFLLRRQKTEDRDGRSNYYDLLFLWILWGVAATGMLLVIFRLTELTMLGYPVYFVHLVLVYFLLWYMPFSKFAHMIYRFLGLIILKMHRRENKAIIFSNN